MSAAGSSARGAVPGAFVLGMGHCDKLGLDLMMGDGT